MTKYRLNVIERLTALSVLPKEGAYTTLRVMRQLQNKLSFQESELKKFEVVTEGEQIKWNQEGQKEVEIEIGEKAADLIIEALKNLDKNKKLTQQHYSIYQKFVEGEKPDAE